MTPTKRRVLWVGLISLANASAAGLVATRLVQDAVGAGWGTLVPSASVATLALTYGGLWWGTRRRARLLTGLGVGLAVGVLVHPVMWYLGILVSFFSGERTSLGDPVLTPVEGLTAVWLYAGISLVLTGWLSIPISAAICGAGLDLYGRRVATSTTGAVPSR